MAVYDESNPLTGSTLRFTEDQVSEIVEWFDANSKPSLVINDSDIKIHVITIEKLMKFLDLKKYHRRSFHYPTYAEIMILVEKLKAGVLRLLTKEQFLFVLNELAIEPNLKHELKLAFQVFDTESRHFLEIDEIQAIVTGYADIFNNQETNELLRDANIRGDGNVYYEDFVDNIFNMAPELNSIKADYLYINPDEDPSVPPEPIIEEIIEPPQPIPPPPPAKKKKKK